MARLCLATANQRFALRVVDNTKIHKISLLSNYKKIFIDTIDGSTEHLHSLFGLNAEMTISKALQLMKGESAFWMNAHKITKIKFEWADEYYAVSVSESHIEKVRAYILNQEEHHRKVTFQEEYEKFMRLYNFEHHG